MYSLTYVNQTGRRRRRILSSFAFCRSTVCQSLNREHFQMEVEILSFQTMTNTVQCWHCLHVFSLTCLLK